MIVGEDPGAAKPHNGRAANAFGIATKQWLMPVWLIPIKVGSAMHR